MVDLILCTSEKDSTRVDPGGRLSCWCGRFSIGLQQEHLSFPSSFSQTQNGFFIEKEKLNLTLFGI